MKLNLLLFFLLTTNFAFSQIMLKGIVTDKKGEAIIGANVSLKDTYDGTSSEIDGSFTFETYEEGEQILTFTYVGFESIELPINLTNKDLTFEIKMEEEANELNTVTISAGSFEASDEKKAVILNSLDIVTTAGANADIATALNTLPGTQVVGEEGQLFVRGGAAYETRTFIDGMFVQNPFSTQVPDVPARGRFSPFLFKGTMFSTGGYSAEFGQALSSALILNTTDLPTESTTGLSLMTLGAGLSHTQLWDKTSLAATGFYTNLGAYLALSPPQNTTWDRPPQSASGQVVFRHKTSETGIFKAHADVSKTWFSLQYPDLQNVGERTKLDLTNDNFYGNMSFKEIIGEKWTFFSGISYTFNTDIITENYALDADEQSFQGKVTLTNNVNDNFKVKFGGEYLINKLNQDFTDSNGDLFLTDLQENYWGFFAEADYYFSRKFVARFGTRWEKSEILDKQNVAPRLSLAYKVNDHSQFSFAYGQFYQTPENQVLTFNDENTDLGFERADHYMLNYQRIKDTRTFRIEAYHKEYKDLVLYENPNTPWFRDNGGDGYARGIDVFFRDRAGMIKNGDFWVSYSFLDTERYWREFPIAAIPRFASKHNASLVYKHWLPKITSSLGFTYTFASPRPYNDPNLSEFNSERTKTFNDLSFNFNYLTNIGGNFTVLVLSVNNILGFKNNFGYRFANQPDDNGEYQSYEIQPNFKRFFFVGCFVSIGQRYSKDNGVTSKLN